MTTTVTIETADGAAVEALLDDLVAVRADARAAVLLRDGRRLRVTRRAAAAALAALPQGAFAPARTGTVFAPSAHAVRLDAVRAVAERGWGRVLHLDGGHEVRDESPAAPAEGPAEAPAGGPRLLPAAATDADGARLRAYAAREGAPGGRLAEEPVAAWSGDDAGEFRAAVLGAMADRVGDADLVVARVMPVAAILRGIEDGAYRLVRAADPDADVRSARSSERTDALGRRCRWLRVERGFRLAAPGLPTLDASAVLDAHDVGGEVAAEVRAPYDQPEAASGHLDVDGDFRYEAGDGWADVYLAMARRGYLARAVEADLAAFRAAGEPDAGGAAPAPSREFRAVPLSLPQANEVVRAHHRHCRPARVHRFSVGLEHEGRLVGVAIVGPPVCATLMRRDRGLAEVLRVAVAPDAPRNACSFLLGQCARAWAGMGGTVLTTYTLLSEGGASLRAAGFKVVGEVRPHDRWAGKERRDGIGRAAQAVYAVPKLRWERRVA